MIWRRNPGICILSIPSPVPCRTCIYLSRCLESYRGLKDRIQGDIRPRQKKEKKRRLRVICMAKYILVPAFSICSSSRSTSVVCIYRSESSHEPKNCMQGDIRHREKMKKKESKKICGGDWAWCGMEKNILISAFSIYPSARSLSDLYLPFHMLRVISWAKGLHIRRYLPQRGKRKTGILVSCSAGDKPAVRDRRLGIAYFLI